MLTYYDHHLGHNRYKRRYVWALWAFIAGIILGSLITSLL